jgi:hypothetical protein
LIPVKSLSGRLVLREKVDSKSINPIEEHIYRKLKLNNYKHSALDNTEQNEFCNIVQFKTSIDLKDMLKPLGLGNAYYRSRMKSAPVLLSTEILFSKFAELFVNNVKINFLVTQELCNYWNKLIIEFKPVGISKININETSKTYFFAAVLFTHTMYFKAHSLANMKRAIDIIIKFGDKLPVLTSNKKSIFQIFTTVLTEKRMDLLFSCDSGFDFINRFYYKGSKHNNVFNGKFKSLFKQYFSSNNINGEKYFKKYEVTLSKWFDSISKEFTSPNSLRKTCELKLIGANKNCNSLIEEYFSFLSMQKTMVGALDIVKETWWLSFVDYVRYTLGYSDFWKIKAQVDKTK